ncbi:MAG: site-2 protease family protein [Kiritimatiellaeota bacterium]|nr:site-2 protease family protein [Kiritimatiellota bacterium]
MLGGSFQIARIRGIPIRVHVTLVVFLPVIAMQLTAADGWVALGWGLLAAVGLFLSVALHELGHSVISQAKGCPVRDILLLPIGGIAQMTRLPDRPRDEFQIALAGPLVSAALYLIGFWGLAPWAQAGGQKSLEELLALLGVINLQLALFNLLPSFPMDGGRILRAWLTPKLGRLLATRIAASLGKFMAVLFGLAGLWPPMNLMLVVIAVFLYSAAGAEYRMVAMQERAQQPPPFPFGPWAASRPETTRMDPDDVTVSPPPYRRD